MQIISPPHRKSALAEPIILSSPTPKLSLQVSQLNIILNYRSLKHWSYSLYYRFSAELALGSIFPPAEADRDQSGEASQLQQHDHQDDAFRQHCASAAHRSRARPDDHSLAGPQNPSCLANTAVEPLVDNPRASVQLLCKRCATRNAARQRAEAQSLRTSRTAERASDHCPVFNGKLDKRK